MAVLELIPLLLVLLCVGGLVWLWVAALRHPPGPAMPACGRCGYAVKGLTALSCPECGGDLREVGITTPRSRQKVTPLVFVMLWTLLLPVPALVISAVWATVYAPRVDTLKQTIRLMATQANHPDVTVEIDQRVTSWGGAAGYHVHGSSASIRPHGGGALTLSVPAALGDTRITLQPRARSAPLVSPHPADLELDLSRNRGHYNDAGATIAVGVPPSEQELIDWFKSQAVTTSDAELRADAADLIAIIQAIASGTGMATVSRYTSGGGGSSSSSGQAAWFGGVLLLLWLPVYVGGIVIYFRVRRRRLTPAAPSQAPPATPQQSPAS